MQSPRAEWTLGIVYLVVLDWLRARGEADDDTLSEVIRNGCHVETRTGRAAFTVTLAAGAVAFHRHICKETR